jgi:hypothetical protein
MTGKEKCFAGYEEWRGFPPVFIGSLQAARLIKRVRQFRLGIAF